MNVRRLAVLAASLLIGVISVRADDAAPWVAKARAYLGNDQALNAVRSLHFRGSFAGTEVVPDPADPKKTIEQPVRIGIDIIFQKPMQQRQVLRSDKIERATVLDDYDAWERVTEVGGKGKTRITLLDAQNIKRLRATTIENLSFYANYSGGSRQVRYLGEATVDGVACAKLSFSHSDSIVFLRYFDEATGRLVKTEIEGGGEIREEGEIVVNGVRFPRKVINKAPGGRMTSITFEQVTINETFPAETFAVPPLIAK